MPERAHDNIIDGVELNIVALDLETYLLLPGAAAPKIICGSTAYDNTAELMTLPQTLAFARKILRDKNTIIAGANIAYDFACLAAEDETFLLDIFQCMDEGRVHDVQICEMLHGIYEGGIGLDPRTGKQLRSPTTGKPSRYSLEVCVDLVLGRTDAKKNDVWRLSYALLEGIPIERWPESAREYPKDDAVNTLQVAVAQIRGVNGSHEWVDIPPVPGGVGATVCKHCNEELTFSAATPSCYAAPKIPRSNQQNMKEQVQAAFALHLGACWGLRTDTERVEALSRAVEAQHAVVVERFQKKGWIRADGTEDQAEIKRAIASAYGATGKCPRCDGTGIVRNVKLIPCRGVKVKNRFQGCQGAACVCGGRGENEKLGNEVTCKTLKDDDENIVEAGCDGTGFDLSTAPMMPRSDGGGVKTDCDAKMESGDDDLYDYGEDEVNKIRDTYIPYIRSGLIMPRPNVLVASGRCSYDTIHQMPRKGGVRECIRARDGRVLISSDYAAGELCSLSQITYWHVGYSKMMDTINETKDPGSLHTKIGAQMLGISYEECQARVKAGDKQAKDFRQAAKCFHPDTEILTRRRGWVKVSELNTGDEVASVVAREERPKPLPRVFASDGKMLPASGERHTRAWHQKNKNIHPMPSMEIVWTKPERLTKRKATEGLLHIENKNVNLRVTPDHRMLTFGCTKLLKTVEATDFGKQRGWFSAGMWKGGELDIDERLLRLAVAVQADGGYIVNGKHEKTVKLGFSKKRKIDRLQALLLPGEYKRSVYRNGSCQPTTWFILSDTFSATMKAMLDYDKTIPWAWMELTPKLREAVLDEVAFWDAHKMQRCYRFSTTIKKNAEVLQAIASITNRKATFTNPTPSKKPRENELFILSVKDRHYTRGENVNTTKVDYDGDVYCLTVPSDCVLVRDCGKVVITHQCASFGFPGGLGAATLVITNRRKAAGSTTAPDGHEYTGIRFCVLMGGAERCGIEKTTTFNNQECPPVCVACARIVQDVLKPAFFETYPEVKAYLKKIALMTDEKRVDSGRIPCVVWDAKAQRPRILRERGKCGYTDGANQGFQGLLSDIGKRAFYRMTREGYLGVRADGSPSVLAGSRFPVFLHDEPLAEVPIEIVHEAGYRISEIMIECGQELAPDVYWKAEPAAMRFWYKSAEASFNEHGRLIPWEPK